MPKKEANAEMWNQTNDTKCRKPGGRTKCPKKERMPKCGNKRRPFGGGQMVYAPSITWKELKVRLPIVTLIKNLFFNFIA